MHLPTDWLFGGSLPLTYPPGHLHWTSQWLYCSPPNHTAVTTISQVRLNIRHSRSRYAVYACACACWHTCGCLLRTLRRMQPECLRHADWQMRLSGFRVPHNSPLSIYPQGEREWEWHGGGSSSRWRAARSARGGVKLPWWTTVKPHI